MKKFIEIIKGGFKKVLILSMALTIMIVFCSAAPDTAPIDNLVKWIAAWAGKIGLVVAFFGGIQTALGFKGEDADAKVRGLKTLAAGFMVYSISASLDLFML